MALPGVKFEIECFNYLQATYGAICKPEHFGKSNSTLSDIKVTAGCSSFFIEVKAAKAQAGQFVLLPDYNDRKFIFSPANQTEANEYTTAMTDHMNAGFELFINAGTRGQALALDSHIYSLWIMDYYRSKGVRFFMSKKNHYIILPLDRFEHYFDVTAKFRMKRSGSSEPSPGSMEQIVDVLKSQYGATDPVITGKKLFVRGDSAISKQHFKIGQAEYRISPKTENQFEIRKLSDTYNSNVIFSTSLKAPQDPADLQLFEQAINQ